jgi:hypothetical protein
MIVPGAIRSAERRMHGASPLGKTAAATNQAGLKGAAPNPA